MKRDFGFIQLLLNLHYAVCLLRVLILDKVFFELGESDRVGRGGGKEVPWVLGEKFIDNFGEELVCDQGWVFVIGDYDASDAFASGVDVECVGF